MQAGQATRILRHVQDRLLHDLVAATDAELLAAFLHARDDAAFEALVRRHGRMVLGVCRRLLGHQQDAEDAFQATFLVLARKAATVRPPGMLGNWLHGVAGNVARRLRAMNQRRRSHERQMAAMPECATPAVPDLGLAEVLDAELGRLPEKYRLAVILCDLEG